MSKAKDKEPMKTAAAPGRSAQSPTSDTPLPTPLARPSDGEEHRPPESEGDTPAGATPDRVRIIWDENDPHWSLVGVDNLVLEWRSGEELSDLVVGHGQEWLRAMEGLRRNAAADAEHVRAAQEASTRALADLQSAQQSLAQLEAEQQIILENSVRENALHAERAVQLAQATEALATANSELQMAQAKARLQFGSLRGNDASTRPGPFLRPDASTPSSAESDQTPAIQALQRYSGLRTRIPPPSAEPTVPNTHPGVFR
ncbi:hypothetical protein EJ06DRAFT_585720 [Trichodelitschia bisporula]|uniref:Uncharacterized protein n=1 Tax=Trichodelitschia bisporula TaxID=703511 RepID=A0A6G1HI83_9PEZI|nr:hypothetical protein EJ06DRAFT_585720 [Trichodelitschia bisporula]